MTTRGGQVHGFESAATFLVQYVETLHQADKVAHFSISTVATTVVAVHDVGRASDRGKHRAAISQFVVFSRIPGLQGERRGRIRKQRFKQIAGKSNSVRILVDVKPGRFKISAGRW